MEIPFIKMEANGNNYLILQEESVNKNLQINNLVSKMSNKNYGIGSDGVLILSNTYRPIPYLEIYNSDGSKAVLCVNGLRIISKYLYDTKYKDKEILRIKTESGVYETFNSLNTIIVKVKIENTYREEIFYYNNKRYRLFFLDFGNSHVYILNDGINMNYFKNVLGRQLSQRFDANVGLITPINPNLFSILTYERGSKLTQSCGSNICGATKILLEQHYIDEDTNVEVETLGGNASVKIKDNDVFYSGTVNLICKGTYYL